VSVIVVSDVPENVVSVPVVVKVTVVADDVVVMLQSVPQNLHVVSQQQDRAQVGQYNVLQYCLK